MYENFIKKSIDFTIAVITFLIFSPIFLIIYIAVKLESKGGFFFYQQRIGKNGELFNIFKIRTMTDKPREASNEVLKGNAEVTRVGAFLRRFKIDEFPQIINVLKGDMSFIGPRPCMPSLLDKFNEDAKKRLETKPGLTGLAQTNGNIYLTWEERWRYDKYYVENMSFLLDVKIFFKTLLLLFVGEEKLLKKTNV